MNNIVFFSDTHCHLDFHAFDDDREAVIERSRRQGINRILNPGIDIETTQKAIQLAKTYPTVYAAAGIHPHDASTWQKNTYDDLFTLADQPKVVAIGEIGLDYYRDHSPRTIQRDVFRAQLELAVQLKKPVIIHCREAEQDMLAILSGWRAGLTESDSPLQKNPGVLHSFSGDGEFAGAVLRLGFKIGITGPVTFKNAHILQAVVKSTPLDSLLIETDAPFLTPQPQRGQRNEPGYVKWVAEKIGELKDLSTEAVAEATSNNADTLFQWRD